MFVLAAEALMVIEEVLNCTETWKKTVKKKMQSFCCSLTMWVK